MGLSICMSYIEPQPPEVSFTSSLVGCNFSVRILEISSSAALTLQNCLPIEKVWRPIKRISLVIALLIMTSSNCVFASLVCAQLEHSLITYFGAAAVKITRTLYPDAKKKERKKI